MSLLIKCVNPNEKKKHIVKQYTKFFPLFHFKHFLQLHAEFKIW